MKPKVRALFELMDKEMKNMDANEVEDTVNILSAIRGPDFDGPMVLDLKLETTAVVRAVLPIAYHLWRAGLTVAAEPIFDVDGRRAMDYVPDSTDLSAARHHALTDAMRYSTHFAGHITRAIDAINKS